MEKRLIAVIHLGTSFVRMKIAEYSQKEVLLLETLTQTIPIGKEIYKERFISRRTIDRTLSIIQEFILHTKTYAITDIRMFSTPAVLEAKNCDIFLDNIRMYTGVFPNQLDINAEMKYYYLALNNDLLEKISVSGEISVQKKTAALLKIGGGTCTFTAFQANRILITHTFSLGSVRLANIYEKYKIKEGDARKHFEILINHELFLLKKMAPKLTLDRLYFLSDEMEILSTLFNADNDEMTQIELDLAMDELVDLGQEQIFHKYHLLVDHPETLLPTATLGYCFLNFFKKNSGSIVRAGLIDGYLELERFNLNPTVISPFVEKQLIHDCISIGRSLKFDEGHARTVSKMSLKIFDALQEIHCLGSQEKLFLMAAALLHDTGTSISNHAHNLHSQYIINANNFFSLNAHEKKMVGHIARYHRLGVPDSSHFEFNQLGVQDRMTILKLSSFLRIADALDYSHQQNIKELRFVIGKKQVTIEAISSDFPFGEVNAFSSKKDFFEMMYGMHIELLTLRY